MRLGQATLGVTSGWDLTGGYGYGRKDTDQGSQERGATAQIPIRDGNLEAGIDWTARIRDRNDYGFVQSTWRIMPRTFSVDASYWVSRDMTDYFLDNETNTAVDLPSTYYLRQEGWLLFHYVLSDGTELQGRYGYDTWKVEDFAATDIPLLGVAGTPAAASSASSWSRVVLPGVARRATAGLVLSASTSRTRPSGPSRSSASRTIHSGWEPRLVAHATGSRAGSGQRGGLAARRRRTALT